MDLKNIDLNVLVNFEVLISESHVTRAADKLGMSQPQMSAVLSRLRTLFDDPLLVRTPHGMQPTSRALEVLGEVRLALQHVQAAFGTRSGFDPAASVRTFKLAASDSLALLLLPSLLAHFCVEAPSLKVVLRPAIPNRIRDWLETGEVDLAIGYWSRLSDGLYASTLFQQRLCVIAARTHPSIRGSVSMSQYVAAKHVFFGAEQTMTSTLESSIDEALLALGAVRDVAARVPSLILTPDLVASTSLIATVPQRLARRYAEPLSLQLLELPFEVPRPDITMVWHQRAQKDGGHQWLRQQLRDICDGFPTSTA